MMPTAIFEGFSVSHVAILDGATSGEDAALTIGQDVYGVRSGALDPDTGTFDNEGDDSILSSWYWLNFATLTVTAGYISLPVLAAITGRAISSSGTGATQKFGFDLWHQDDMNVAPKPVLVRCPSKDSAGAVRRLDFILYKVQFGPFTFNGPAYKAGMEVSYTGRALSSTANEQGVAFADGKLRVGRLLSGAVI
jgi:hypothetical protein